MAFSQTQYQTVTDRIDSAMADLSWRIRQVVPAASAGTDHWYVPGFVRDAVLWLAAKLVNIAEALWQKVTQLMEGAAAPVLFFADAFGWQDVRGLADGVVGHLDPTELPSNGHWSGTAERAYAAIVPTQTNAAARIGTVAGGIAKALDVCAGAGLAFYVALGVIVAQLVMSMAAAVAAFGSVAFSWTGVTIAVGDTSVSAGMIGAAVAALIALLGTQATELVSLHGEAVDDSVFPGGRWPDARSESYGYPS